MKPGDLVMIDYIGGARVALVLEERLYDRYHLQIVGGLYDKSTCNRHWAEINLLSSA